MALPDRLKKYLPSVFVAIYLAITLAALKSTNHILYNLEPYPDGLLYALSARNYVLGRGLQLVYSTFSLPLWVPPLYAWVLVPGYIISPAPWMFYLTNCILGTLTISGLYYAGYRLTNSSRGGIFTIVAYLAHAIIFWLPTVPMTENLTLLLITGGLLAFLDRSPKKWEIFVSIASLVGLSTTRYSAVPLSLALGLLLALLILRKCSKRFIAITLISLFILFTIQELGGVKLLAKSVTLVSTVFSNPQFYNVDNIPQTMKGYAESLIGLSGNFYG